MLWRSLRRWRSLRSVSSRATPTDGQIWPSVFWRERDRWFLWVPALFGIGIATYFALLHEPGWATSVFPLAAALALRSLSQQHRVAVLFASVLFVMAAGFLAAKVRTTLVATPVLSSALKRADVLGRVERMEVRADQSRRLTLRVVRIDGMAPGATPFRVRIRTRKSEQTLNTGDVVRLKARIAPPPGPARPRGYDFARAAYFQGLGGIGFAVSPIVVETSEPGPSFDLNLTVQLQTLRRQIGHRIEEALPGEVGVMANALMTGERSGISEETNDLYRDAGIFHILSISGLHMAIMGGSVFLALRFLLAGLPMLALRYPIKKWAAASAALATFAYLLISGGAYPTVRSFIMIFIMFTAIMLDRPAIALRNVALAALLILIVIPESLFNAGFQLSFAAVTGLVAVYEAHQNRMQRQRRQGYETFVLGPMQRTFRACWVLMAGTVVTTVIAGMATAPFAAFHFHTGQKYAVLTNMLAIPVSNLLVMPAALAAFVAMPLGFEEWPLALMGQGIEIMTWSAEQVTALPGAVAAIPAFSETALQLMIAGGLWLCIWREHWRWFGVPIVIFGLYHATDQHYPDALIGKNGALVALRDETGKLSAAKAHYASYEFGRWLEADGDVREPEDAWGRDTLRCDLEGCTGKIGPHLVAMPRSPAALVDDCRRADVLILTFPKPVGCKTDARVFDYPLFRRTGTLALYLEQDGTLRSEYVEQFRGTRPWTEAARLKVVRGERSKLKRRNATQHPTPSTVQQRPAIESDGHPLYWTR